jgi:GNAT superfamily N-acetyltransferase/transcriptional regulator with XRE-family HTH domain
MSDFNDKAIIERVIMLRAQFAGPRGRSRFAAALGISPSTYSYYEGDRVPPIEILLKICDLTGADLHWLLTGKSGEKKFAAGPHGALLEKHDSLLTSNPELANPVSAFIELLNEKRGIEKKFGGTVTSHKTNKAGKPGWIPILGRTAAGIVHCWDQHAHPEELDTVLVFLKEAAEWLQEKGEGYWQDWHTPPQNFVNWIRGGFDKNEFYMVECSEEVIGCFRLQWDDELFWGKRKPDAGYVHSFTLSRQLAGKGIGTRVLNELEKVCLENGRTFLRLDCGVEVRRLRQYYEEYGFTKVDATTVLGEDLALYEKRIGPDE